MTVHDGPWRSMGQWVKWLHIPWVNTSQVITPGRASLVSIRCVDSSWPRPQTEGLPKDFLARFPGRWRSTQQSTQGTTVDFHVKRYETIQKQKRYLPWYWVIGLSLVKPMFVWNLSKALDLPSPPELPAVPCCFPHLMIRLKGQHENCSSVTVVTSASPEKHRVARSLFHPKKETQQVATCYGCYGCYSCYHFLSRCVFSDLRAFNRILCRQASLRDFQVLDIRHGSPLSIPFHAKVALWWESSTQLSRAKNCHARMHVTLVPQILQIVHASVRGRMPVSNDDGPCREATLESCKHLSHPTRAMLSIKPRLRINNYIVFLASFDACARKDRKGMTKDSNGT